MTIKRWALWGFVLAMSWLVSAAGAHALDLLWWTRE